MTIMSCNVISNKISGNNYFYDYSSPPLSPVLTLNLLTADSNEAFPYDVSYRVVPEGRGEEWGGGGGVVMATTPLDCNLY